MERQGRITYPRIDLFLFHYTILRRQEETKVTHVFQSFKDWWQREHRDVEDELKRLRLASTHFKEMVTPGGHDAFSEFARLIKALDVSTLTPVVLALRQKLPRESAELRQALSDLASFIVRRAVCGLTTKSYNKLFLRLLQVVHDSETAAQTLRRYLLGLHGESQEWPSDADFEEKWLYREVYSELRPSKVCAVLRALEVGARGPKQETEVVPLQSSLTVEHVLPQSWNTTSHYMFGEDSVEARARRNRLTQTFGNLTLLTQALNSAVSNGPFNDYDKDGTEIAGKRTEFRKSVLLLNSYFQDKSVVDWNDEAIVQRGKSLFKQATVLWPRPALQ